MKICFLDVDGVLNSQDYQRRIGGFRGSSRSAEFLDPDAIKRLNRVTTITGANIVLSSSWRYGYLHDLEGLQAMFKRNDIIGNVIGMTPVIAGPRGAEIQSWLNDHDDVETFVIIDDSDDMIHLLPHLVRTTLAYGLQDSHVLAIIAKLCPVMYIK